MPYPTRGAWQFRNVTDAFDFWPILSTVSIEQLHPDGLAAFTCDVVPVGGQVFANEDRVWVKFNGTKIWAGHLKVVERGFLDEDGQNIRVWRLVGQDYTAKLADSVITAIGERPRESADDRVAWLLTYLDFPVTTTGVVLPNEFVEPSDYENMRVSEALAQVADELILHFYIDFGPDGTGPPDLHIFRTENDPAPFDLDDAAPNYTTTFPYSYLKLPEESTELATAIRVVGDRIRRWVTDPAQIALYGRQEMPITDPSLRTTRQLVAAGNRALDQHDRPEVDGSLLMHEPGMRAGHTFDLVNDEWALSATYIATSVSVRAVDPHDADGKAYLFADVRFTDKRRVGRMPGRRGGGGSTDDINDVARNRCSCPGPVKTEDEPTDDFDDTCLPYLVSETDPAALSGSSSYNVAYPAGTQSGDYIIAWYVTDGLDPTFPAAWDETHGPGTPFHRGSFLLIADGTETGTFTVSFSGTTTLLIHVSAWRGVVDHTASSTWPWSGAARVVQARTVSGGSISAGPTGWELISNKSGGSNALGVAHQIDNVAPNDSTDWTNTGVGLSNHYNLQGSSTSGLCPLPGQSTTGGSFEGGNDYVFETQSVYPDGWTVTSGQIIVTSETPDGTLAWHIDSPPTTAWEMPIWEQTWTFVLEDAGSLTDTGERYLEVHRIQDGREAFFRARFGDAVRAAGVEVQGDPGDPGDSDFQAVAITPGETYLFKIRWDSTTDTAEAKMWDADTAEPAYQATLTTFVTTDDDLYQVTLKVGNDGTEQVLRVLGYVTATPALSGESVARHVVDRGDGATTTFTTDAFQGDSLDVWVDGIPVVPPSFVPSTGVFTFDYPPAVGAWIEAAYTMA